MVDRDVNETLREINYTLSIEQKHNLSKRFAFPLDVAAYALETDCFVRIDTTGERVVLTIDNHEADELEQTAEEQRREEFEEELKRIFDISRGVIGVLADEYESIDEILEASRAELTSISGIGEATATRILHRHSRSLEKRMKSKAGAVPVIEDTDGVLRLPEEYESGEHTPKH
jgi:NAD-dependent DNA ligase